jgi:T-complex protein 1 subunit delta
VNTCLSSKVVANNRQHLSPLAVDAVLKIIDTKTATNVDLRDIKIVKKLGGTIDDTSMVEGMVFPTLKPSKSAGGPTSMKNAKIALIQFCISSPKTDVENQIVVADYNAMDRILREEKKYVAAIVAKIVKSGANCVLI